MPAIGATLNSRYRILDKVGEGGQSKVYLAADVGSNSKGRVIIKEMIASVNEDENTERLTLFMKEYELLKDLSHPLLIKVYDSFQEKDNYYIIEEYVTGLTLESIIKKEPVFEEERAVEIIIDLADVLSYLHKNNIIYRDIKPSNIIIHQDDQRARLVDFNIARTFKIDKEKDTVAIGTYGYSPPEQYGRGQTDCRSDIYSLGVLLHQLVTGIDPVIEPFNRQFSHPYPSTKKIIEKAASIRCSDRYQTAEEFKQALQDYSAKKLSQHHATQILPPVLVTSPLTVSPVLPSSKAHVQRLIPFWSNRNAMIGIIVVGVLIWLMAVCHCLVKARLNVYDETLLHCVIQKNTSKDTVKLLIALGADVKTKDIKGFTPLHKAVFCGRKDIAELFIAKGADINAKDKFFLMTPLHYTASRGHRDIAELLLDKGASIDALDKENKTPLHYAARKGYKNIAELLLDKGADVNVKDKDGVTPLLCAISEGHKEIVELLIYKGANVNARNNKGTSLLWYAISRYGSLRYANLQGDAYGRAFEIIELLRQHGAME